MKSFGLGIVVESLDDRDDRILIHLGHHAPSVLVIGARHLDDALEAAAAWAADHAPGVFVDMTEAYRDASEDLGISIDTEDFDALQRLQEHAEVDLTYTESGWLDWTWSYEESPDRERIFDLQSRHCHHKRGEWVAMPQPYYMGPSSYMPREVARVIRVNAETEAFTVRTFGGRIVHFPKDKYVSDLYDNDLQAWLEGGRP